jgi:quercetin dioxygenase-like cupin family protein
MPEYTKVDVDDLPDAPNPTRHKKEVDEAVGATEFGFNVYVAAPGEELPWGYHRHPDHEEVFYVVEGTLAVDTEDGELTVERGEALFVGPDSPNEARAVGDVSARVVAVGAPKERDDAVIAEACPACGEVTDRTHEREGDAYVLSCVACGETVDRLTPGPD